MRAIRDPDRLLAEGLAAIRAQFRVPGGFPAEVEAEAEAAAAGPLTEHVDRTDMPFVTLDPATATDLDQAFALEPAGGDWLLHYAIADVDWFVADGDPLDQEAWKRGETIYLPDGKAALYPRALSEGAASLLPDGPRPAVIFTSRIDPAGRATLHGVERAVVRSRAKLAYETVRPDQLPVGFDEVARRLAAADNARGAARVDPPEQEVERDASGHFTLRLRPMAAAERQNAALSLATNLAVAEALHAAGTGLFRVMEPPSAEAEERLRHTAQAFGLTWPEEASLAQFERLLDPSSAPAAAFMLAVRRAGNGASYLPYRPGVIPWHAAMAATYCHMTAPLRRLADRYVISAALAVANGHRVPLQVEAAFAKLGPVMDRADNRSGQIERAVVDLAEAAILAGREGETFEAVVTDHGDSGTRFQLCALPVVARAKAHRVRPGDRIHVRLESADPARREVRFARQA